MKLSFAIIAAVYAAHSSLVEQYQSLVKEGLEKEGDFKYEPLDAGFNLSLKDGASVHVEFEKHKRDVSNVKNNEKVLWGSHDKHGVKWGADSKEADRVVILRAKEGGFKEECFSGNVTDVAEECRKCNAECVSVGWHYRKSVEEVKQVTQVEDPASN